MSVDLKTLTPDTTLPTTGFLFGADSQASSTPSVYGTAAVATAVGLQFPAGAQATPSISTTGDNDTGIWFPAANTVAVSTNALERMRIDASGNVGIGTSSPTSARLVVETAALGATSGNTTGLIRTFTNTGNQDSLEFLYSRTASSPTAWTTADLILRRNVDGTAAQQQIRFTGDAATTFWTNSNERMRIDSSGNVGIGATTSPGGRLEVTGAGSTIVDARLRINNPNASSFSTSILDLYSNGRTRVEIYGQQDGTGNGGFFILNTSDSAGALQERMRITAAGEVYIAGTTDQGAYNLQCNGTGVWGAGAYVNGSDARIKDDVAPIVSGLDVVTKLRPVQFRYKESWSKERFLQPGFIAQELQEAMSDQPYLEGVVQQGPQYMSVAYQSLIPVLTKAVQELSAKVAALEAR